MTSAQNSNRIKRSPGRPKRVEQDAPTHEFILRTASGLFMEYGYEPVSLQQIAKICGVTKASIYYHFDNKAALFTAAVTAMMQKAQQTSQRIMQEDKPLYDRLVHLAEMRLRFPHGDFETIMREAAPSLTKEQHDEIRRSEERIHDVLTVSFAEAIRKGDMQPLHPLLMAHTLASMLMLGNREIAQEFGPSAQDLAHDIIHMFWNGVGVEPRSHESK